MTAILLQKNQHIKLIGFKSEDWQTAGFNNKKSYIKKIPVS